MSSFRTIFGLALGLCLLVGATWMLSQNKPKPERGKIETNSANSTEEPETSEEDKEDEEWGGLTVHRTGATLDKAEHIVVLLHGFGADGMNLVPMGQLIRTDPKTCFIFPEAPIELGVQRRAWWNKPELFEEARSKVHSLVQYVRKQNESATLTLGGFSQGAILSSNFLEQDSDGITAFLLFAPSGQLRYDVTGELAEKPPVFLAHGKTDAILPFEGSEKLYHKLLRFDYEVDWFPFDDGHTISQEAIEAASRFLARIRAEARQTSEAVTAHSENPDEQ